MGFTLTFSFDFNDSALWLLGTIFNCYLPDQEAAVPRSKYEEDIYINNHTTVWGSWWKDHQWGYKCCKQTIRNSYCTGAAGIEAAEAASDLMKANIARKEAATGSFANKHHIYAISLPLSCHFPILFLLLVCLSILFNCI